MRRVLLGVLAFVVLLLVVLGPGLGFASGEQDRTDEPTRITDYVASFDVAADATMRVTEVLTVDFPSYPSRRGIFRFFDHHDDNAPGLRRVPRDVRVVRDGSPEPYTEYDEGKGRYTVLRIGRESVTLPRGPHTYVIDYTIDHVLLPAGDDRARFYWNLVPGGWDQPIDEARLSVRLPAETSDVRCAVATGTTSGCSVSGEGTSDLLVTVSDLEPRTPVTLSARLPVPAPDASGALPWSGRWDPVLGTSVAGLLAVLGLAAVAGLVGLRLARTAHEPTPPYPLLYAPPEGIGPAQAQYVLTEHTGRTAFVATMMDAAEHGAVELDRADGRWTLTGRDDAASVASLDPVTREVLDGLGVRSGQKFVADADWPSSGKVLQRVIKKQDSAIPRWAADEGLMTATGLGSLGGAVIALFGVGAFALALLNPLGMSVSALVPGAFAAAGLSLLAKGSGTRRTAAGRDLWSRLGGFRRVLATPSSQLRFDFSARRELYTAYLPWAVAFGVADEWASKYRTEMGVEPPAPAYFAHGYAGSHTGNHVDQMVNDFRGTVQSSIAAYESSIRPASSGSGSGSSGGGGGGFSGGGGGGGGGGGSW